MERNGLWTWVIVSITGLGILGGCVHQRQTTMKVPIPGGGVLEVPWATDPIIYKMKNIRAFQRQLEKAGGNEAAAAGAQAGINLWNGHLRAELPQVPAPALVPDEDRPVQEARINNIIVEGILKGIRDVQDSQERARREDPDLYGSEQYQACCKKHLEWFEEQLLYWDGLIKQN